jgi:hypothetical protein
MSIASKMPISFRLRLDMTPMSVVHKTPITSIIRGPLGFYMASANQSPYILCRGMCKYFIYFVFMLSLIGTRIWF